MVDSRRVFACKTEALAEVRAFVRGFLDAGLVEKPEAELLVLGVNEAVSNVIRHAAAGEVEVWCERVDGMVRFRLRDFGASPADPARFRRRLPDEVTPGGLGLHLMERIFDRVVYRPLVPGTELELTKNFPPDGGARRDGLP